MQASNNKTCCAGFRNPNVAAILPLILLLIMFLFASGIIPTVRFKSERIDVYVHPGWITVDGRYDYVNPFPFPVSQDFFIPFPVDKDHPVPFDVIVERMKPVAEPLVPVFSFGLHRFGIRFKASEEVSVRVRYSQKAHKAEGRYILKTTKGWFRPLESAEYYLHPVGVEIVYSNYPVKRDEEGRSFFARKGFMPAEDWHFKWEGL